MRLTHEIAIPPMMTSAMIPAKEKTPTTADVFWKKLLGVWSEVAAPPVDIGSATERVFTRVPKDTGPLFDVCTPEMVGIPVGVSGTSEVGAVVDAEVIEVLVAAEVVGAVVGVV